MVTSKLEKAVNISTLCNELSQMPISANHQAPGTRITAFPRFRCQDCRRQFVENATRQPVDETTRQLIDKLLLERLEKAAIARVTGVKGAVVTDVRQPKILPDPKDY